MTDLLRIGDLIRARIEAGTLPTIEPRKVWVGYGQQRICDGCAELIHPAQVEHELEFVDGRKVYLHSGCAGLYEATLRARGHRRKPPR